VVVWNGVLTVDEFEASKVESTATRPH
jgi:hypothetical protein